MKEADIIEIVAGIIVNIIVIIVYYCTEQAEKRKREKIKEVGYYKYYGLIGR